MQFIDLERQQIRIREKINARIQSVMDHGQYIMGPEVKELETKLADFVGVKHSVGVASGTDALLMALMALEVRAGDEVIVPAFSFIATAEVVQLLGAKVVFVDVDPEFYVIDCKKIEEAITEKTRVIIPVGLYGQCADMDTIDTLAKKYQVAVIEDAAQSFGAEHNGRRSCGLSVIACTSFFPSKPLGAYGDGGACFTNDEELASKLKQIRIHGQDKRYHHARLGINGRLDTMQAGILLEKLDIFTDEIKSRARIAKRYTELLKNISGIQIPSVFPGNSHVFAQYTIRAENRDFVVSELGKKNIPTAIHYPIPLHWQPALNSKAKSMPYSEELAGEVFSIPMHPYLEDREIDLISENIAVCMGMS